jgi:hypothetical protein
MSHERRETGSRKARNSTGSRKPRKRDLFRVFGLVLFVSFVSACGDDTPAASTTPTVPRTTETFSGTVQVGGSAFHSFRVGATGNTDITLTAASPPSTVVMGLALGTPDDAGNCNRLAGASVNTAAGSTAQLGSLTSTATLCVQIRDVGNQTSPVAYTVSVTHP